MASYIFIGGTAKGEGEGIRVAKWDANAGTLSDPQLAAAVTQPSFMVAAEVDGKRLLFSGHQPSPTQAALSSFRITPSGQLNLVNTVNVPDEEESFIQIVLDRTHRCLVSASYRTSKVRSFKVAPDGHLSEPVSEFQLIGSGPNIKRQTTAHAHGAVIAPGNNFVLINDLGSDKIMVYKLNASTAEMTSNDPPSYSAAPGSGPRHLAFHPGGKWAYAINELDSTLTLFAWDGAKGELHKLDSTPTLPPDADISKNRAGEVIIDKSGASACNSNIWLCDRQLEYATAYYWKVRAVNSMNISDWSAVSVFITESLPASPTSTSVIPSPAPTQSLPATIVVTAVVAGPAPL